MEQPKNIIWKNSMTYGAILGGALILLMVIVHMLGKLEKSGSGLLDYLLTFSAIVIGTKTLRDKYEGGYITFGRAFASGVLICAFAGIIYSPFQYMFFSHFAPEVLEKIQAIQEEMLLNWGVSEEDVETQIAAAQKFMSPLFIAISGGIGFGIIGSLFSLATSLFLKKEPSPFDIDNTASQE